MENLLNIKSGFTVFGFEIKYYGIIMALSYLLGLFICILLCHKKRYNENLPYKLLMIAFPLAVIGGRLGYVLFSDRTWTFAEIINIRSGGLMLYGGIFLALIGIVIYSLIKRKNPLKYFDLIAPCLIIAQALGRWGNFFNQEAYGSLITNEKYQWFPFGVYITRENFTTSAIAQTANFYGTSAIDGAWFNATFFYESIWCLICFVALYFVFKKTNRVGLTTSLYLVLYGVERFFVEGLRTDSLYLTANLRVSQFVSIIMVVLGLGYIVYLSVTAKNEKILMRQKREESNLFPETSKKLIESDFVRTETRKPLKDNVLLNNEYSILNEIETSGNKRVEKIKLDSKEKDVNDKDK